MARRFGFADGRVVARSIKAEARETCPDDIQGQKEYILGYVGDLLSENLNPHGKPWPATFWRGLGAELKR
jgi:hypothetical protein